MSDQVIQNSDSNPLANKPKLIRGQSTSKNTASTDINIRGSASDQFLRQSAANGEETHSTDTDSIVDPLLPASTEDLFIKTASSDDLFDMDSKTNVIKNEDSNLDSTIVETSLNNYTTHHESGVQNSNFANMDQNIETNPQLYNENALEGFSEYVMHQIDDSIENNKAKSMSQYYDGSNKYVRVTRGP